MRGTVLIATVAALLIAGGATAVHVETELSTKTNRVDNHEFVDWESGTPVHWDHMTGSVAPVDDPVDGSYDGESTRANLTFGGGYSAWILQDSPRSLGEDLPVVPGAQYRLSFMAKFEPRDSTDWEWIWAGALINWRDDLGNSLETTYGTSSSYLGDELFFVHSGSAYDWYGGTFEAPDGATAADVSFFMLRSTLGAYDDASLHVDDVHFWRR